jgi:Tol biopolymer transport system component
MPSIIPGFEYDIFISYRHNDNRSGWVTNFVNALQEELAATIKEPLSIYFDKNPHDGLLETHNVDKSLEGKLRCLIFIPIISQTYCDPKSFAWQYEFCAFNNLAQADSLGRDIKLSNGNFASRVLPIKIHQLDAVDRNLFEKESGSPLRAIEFIYSEAGVNRPLRSNEENPTRNQNQTIYRNQVNKVANTIKTLVASMTNQDLQPEPGTKSVHKSSDQIDYGSSVFTAGSQSNSKLTLAISILLTALVVAAITWRLTSQKNLVVAEDTSGALTRTSILPPKGSNIELIGEATVGVGRRALSISKNGDKIAFIGSYKGRPHIFIRNLNDFKAKVLDQTAGAYGCTLSPNGQEVAYFVGNKLLKVNTSGDNPVVLAESSNPMDIAWISATELLFSADEGGVLLKVGKQVELIGNLSGGWGQTISLIPNTLKVLVSTNDGIGILDISTKQIKQLGLEGASAKFAPPNCIVYMKGSTLISQLLDLETQYVDTDKPYSLPNVRIEAYGNGQFDVSDNGSLIYIEGKDARVGNLVMVNRSGKVDTLTQTTEDYYTFKLSPDESKLAVPIFNASQDLWVIDLKTSKRTRITNSGRVSNPVWASNDALIYRHDTTVYLLSIEKGITTPIITRCQPTSISADGVNLLFQRNADMYIYNMQTKNITRITNTELGEHHGSISPNGQLIAYTLDDTKAFHVYIKKAELGGKTIQISTGEGSEEPRWTRNGKKVIYRSGQQWFEVDVLDYDKLEVSQPRLVLEGDYYNLGGFSYDITGDGERLILVKATPEKTASEIKLVTGWINEVNRQQ